MKIDPKYKIYVYCGAAIAVAAGIYFAVSKSGDKKPEAIPDPERQDGSGKVISKQQDNVPINVANVMNQSVTAARTALLGKKVYTRMLNTKIRSSAEVNNGFLNNNWGVIPDANVLIGTITDVQLDKNNAVNTSGRVYKWVKTSEFSDAALAQMKDAAKESWFNTNPQKNHIGYIREDVIDIK